MGELIERIDQFFSALHHCLKNMIMKEKAKEPSNDSCLVKAFGGYD